MLAVLPGFFAGLSLIIAIGAQNAFVLRQGLTRKHIGLVVLICAASDVALIALGIAGLGAVINSLPWLLEVIRWFGVAYLAYFAFTAARSALKTQTMDASGTASATRGKVSATALALTFLNPHVYLDTVILIGSIANQFETDRWLFGIGAMVASITWFATLGYGAKAASRFMAKPIFWRVLDTIIAVVMVSIAITLALFKF